MSRQRKSGVKWGEGTSIPLLGGLRSLEKSRKLPEQQERHLESGVYATMVLLGLIILICSCKS